ncbi:hypothetical protein J4Q44_G00311420 [Coregonus suidteri]|uniref:Uncharacterized protein n=1 Tax=Coregonus suidteri TaxID=861788 RepID=A0AAN8QQH7_9TELE
MEYFKAEVFTGPPKPNTRNPTREPLGFRCRPSYSGERCHLFTLASEGRDVGGYSRTTALAVVAVVLSSLCLTIIGLLLVLRFHKRGAYDIENEEKVKLGSAPNH